MTYATRGLIVKTLGVVVGTVVLVTTAFWANARWARHRFTEQSAVSNARSITRLADLPRELRESSGVAVSRRHPGLFWSHNDSGDRPRLYAIDATGTLRTSVRVDGAKADDWEDIALGPCPLAPPATPSSCLFVADTGDNELARSVLTVYVVAEPTAVTPGSMRAPAEAVRFRYPARGDDCEALAVMPNGDIVLVTKGRSGSIAFFRLLASDVRRALGTAEVLTARAEGDAGIEPGARVGRLATGAALSPDGRTLAVRTYNAVYFFAAGPGRAAWARLGPPCLLPLDESVGEAVAYLDAETLLLTSEAAGRRPGALHTARCPAPPAP